MTNMTKHPLQPPSPLSPLTQCYVNITGTDECCNSHSHSGTSSPQIQIPANLDAPLRNPMPTIPPLPIPNPHGHGRGQGHGQCGGAQPVSLPL